MVVGLELFTEHFSEFTEHYILIGGGACDRHFSDRDIGFRLTKDLDIILIVEALTPAFIRHFWRFINDGEYELAQIGAKKIFYRFIRPQAKGYPKMLELFSRKPDAITIPTGFHLTDIPTDEDASSLSAILLDDDYYHFTLNNCVLSANLHCASNVALIALKAKAFLNNLQRKQLGQQVRLHDIEKHHLDIILLTVTLEVQQAVQAPMSIKTDLIAYIDIIRKGSPDIHQLFRNPNIINATPEKVIDQLTTTFQLHEVSFQLNK